MLSSLKSFIYNFKAHPLRAVLILITVTIGVATLAITLSLSMDINDALDSASSEQGRRISIINGEINNEGGIDFQQPGRFTPDIISILASDYENLSDIAFFGEAWVKPIVWQGDKTYEIRSTIQTNETYAELMNLEFGTGSFFSKADVDAIRKVVVISALSAKMLFGSPDAALGETVGIAGRSGIENYSVVGVFTDIPDMEREAFGIGDFIFPIMTGLPQGMRIHPIQRGAILMARITDDNLQKAESRIRSILEPQYGEGLILGIYEGLPNGSAHFIEESRNSVKNFALAVTILGFIILVTSSIGIFSVMLVEVLNRARDIGLRRALGTNRAGIRRYFIGQALYYSGIGSIIGIVLSFALYRMVGAYLAPLFNSAGFRATDIAINVPGLLPVVVAVGSSLVFGAIFGFFPALSAARTPIMESIRQDVA
ncbi:MAG: ABC transporter permease [Spirochaetales bacterium]|jgi:putative ABC transport system permease protein|nr:ABC transporter permease [Spirochaetales bacterium]